MDYIDKLYKKINKNNTVVLVFGISTCGYCKAAIKYLQEKNIPYKYYKIDKYYNIFFKILTKLNKKHPDLIYDTNHLTYPIIFINKKFIGGYSELIDIL
jgi:glutaredoxin